MLNKLHAHRTPLVLAVTLVVALVLASGFQPLRSFAQDVQTQVWLDLTATANPSTPDASATAAYQAALDSALATLTAQPPLGAPPTATIAAPTPSVTPLSPAQSELEEGKTDVVSIPGGTVALGTSPQEAASAVDECAQYGYTCDINWTADSIPVHDVMLQPYQIEIYEVTGAQMVAFLNAYGPTAHQNACGGMTCVTLNSEDETSPYSFDGTTYRLINPDFYGVRPATHVTWYGAQGYCQAIGRRLPTEAEWEHAARGPNGSIYPWGNTFFIDNANSAASALGGTVSVYDYPFAISPFGAANMAGNVQEWVSDWYVDNTYALYSGGERPATPAPAERSDKVLRGGSWDTAPLFLRAVHRRSLPPFAAEPSIGFRCATDSGPVSNDPQPPTPVPTLTFTPEG